jgi:hypothetical protein
MYILMPLSNCTYIVYPLIVKQQTLVICKKVFSVTKASDQKVEICIDNSTHFQITYPSRSTYCYTSVPIEEDITVQMDLWVCFLNTLFNASSSAADSTVSEDADIYMVSYPDCCKVCIARQTL